VRQGHREILPVGTKTDTGPKRFWGSRRNLYIGGLCSSKNMDRTANMLRFRGRLIVILATGLH